MAALGREVEAARQLEPQLAERLRGDGRLVGHDQQQVARLGARAARPIAPRSSSERNLAIGERQLAVVLHERPHEAAGAEALDELGQRVELRARHLARARR